MPLKNFNWKNFLRRTVLFFLFINAVHLLYELFSGNYALRTILLTNLYGKLLTAIVFGFVDGKTWNKPQPEEKIESEPKAFDSIAAAVKFYVWFAVFIALICTLFVAVLMGLTYVILLLIRSELSGRLSEIIQPTLVLILIISITFTIYDAVRNYYRLKKRAQGR
ncbi:hypothetical protein ESA94_16705 [Lacibacter luteus]|uniref:Uncharacterized protein n=1 Tax=Lacibacter luteus TaxID=2508719 RepID=A0A4Q1CF71_9BACT|nr:hypothetical protein [Lacibacter luteus]RXK58287.1 hypothetical protein ESA94_16705 [Lacibacter luteus]